MRSFGKFCFLVLVALPVCSFIACSGEERLEFPKSSLEGKVTFKGKPVPYALIIVTGGEQSAQGHADEDGNFLIERVPSGPVTIGVNTDAGRGKMMGEVMSARQSGKAPPSFVDVPPKFFDPNSSGIETVIQDAKGVNRFDIEIR